MWDFVGSIHLEVKSYLVEPLSLNGLTSHASPRAATHTRHAHTNKELVSIAKRRHKKAPATLRLPGRRLEVQLKLFRPILETAFQFKWDFVSLADAHPEHGLLHRVEFSNDFPKPSIGTLDGINDHIESS